MLRVTFLVLFGCFFGAAQAQEMVPAFSRLANTDGLSHNTVCDIAQGPDGLIWLATENGLNRYDGYTFDTWFHPSGQGEGIASNFVQCLSLDRAGNLWVGTMGGGISCINHETGRIQTFVDSSSTESLAPDNSIWSIVELADGDFLLGTYEGGLKRFNPRTRSYTSYRADEAQNGGLSNNDVRCLEPDAKAGYWLGTFGGGLVWFDPQTEVFKQFRHEADNPNSLPDDKIIALLDDPQENALWVATYGGGLARFDKTTETFRTYAPHPEQADALPNGFLRALSFEGGIGGRYIWVGTWQGGLSRFDKTTETFANYFSDSSDPNSLSDNKVLSLFPDASGLMWVGTYGGGLTTFPLQRSHIEKIPSSLTGPSKEWATHVNHTLEDSIFVWAATFNEGLLRLNTNTRQVDRFFNRDTENTGRLQQLHNVWKADKRNLWVAVSRNGLVKWNATDGIVQHFPLRNNNATENASLLSHYEEADGTLWLGGFWCGLIHLDPATSEETRYDHVGGPASGDKPVTILCVLPDGPHHFWLATHENGVSRFDKRDGSVENFRHNPNDANSISGNTVYSMDLAPDGALWIGTLAGLDRIVREPSGNLHVTRFNRENGLPADVVYGVAVTAKNHIWISTPRGLCRLSPNGENGAFNVRTFDQQQQKRMEALLEEISTMRPMLNSEGQRKLFSVVALYKATMKEAGTLEFETQFDDLHLDFFDRLKETIPGITKNETRICAYLKMGLPPTEIAALNQKSLNSINVAFARLRTKMEVRTNEELKAYLTALTTS